MKEFAPIGRHHFVVKQKVATVPATAFPILYLESDHGYTIMWSLVDYFLAYPSRSQTWMRDTARAIGLFYDYNTACQNSNTDRHTQLRKFMSCLEFGTIDTEAQTDPIGLYWAPTGLDKAKRLRGRLADFIDWVIEDELKSKGLSTFKAPRKKNEELTISLLKTAKGINKRSYMEHVKDPYQVAEHLKTTKNAFGYHFEDDPKTYLNAQSELKSFPVELIQPLLKYGFIKNPHATNLFDREDITAKMITLLLLFGGLRKSEPFHLWFNDIMPTNDFECQSRLYHPRLAKVNLLGEKDKTRDLYLRERKLRPRHDRMNSKSYHAGWKKLAVDKSSYHADIFFLHKSAEAMFVSLYTLYLSYRSKLMETYVREHGNDHPFLFVANGIDKRTGESYVGAPYSIGQFDKSYNKALDRLEVHLGMQIPRGRDSALNPHSTRHFYAQALEDMGVSDKVIQKCLRHRTINSQEAYKNVSAQKIRDTLSNYSVTAPIATTSQIRNKN